VILCGALRAALPILAGLGIALSAAPGAPDGAAAALRERVDAVRSEHHLVALEPSEALAAVARGHAEDMARRGYLSHVDLEGRNPLERARAAGVDGFRLLAENIGASSVGGDRAAAVVEEWMRSTLHRENVLNPAFNASGIGVARTPDGTTLFVEVYATF
jgi:uncharacterized protein YkwD